MNLSVFLDELQFFWGLGLLMEEVEFCDVFGLDEELLEMVPNPVLVVLFLYPITAKTEEERLQQENEKKLAAFLENDREMEVAHSVVATTGDIVVLYLLNLKQQQLGRYDMM
ncbi:ubiquitin carboxyl-terminal hydrolase 3-like isoform X5 [Vigna radiata var. radiata]|uniref:Ubiquitin carboxyl-terminal hydrolase 3-like isoform X5 n=1 Tax=Vigna radiata var. radiata TaxID=3916 RepID=A0A3Q0ETP7_VIGRR|nr:ubiquitin carboxyl-terminal hydrolase 3-like isoform X5 [Vigna radiata var. radiata]